MFKVSKLCKTYIIWVLHFFGDSYTITIVYMINHILAQTKLLLNISQKCHKNQPWS